MIDEALSLAHAPIVEAILEVTCDFPLTTDLQRFQEVAKEQLRTVYPKARRQNVESHEFRKEGEKPAEVSVRQEVGALQFFAEDERQIIQFRREGYSFNRLAPYGSLDEYLPEIERTWEIFRKIVEPIQVRRIGLRFINRLPLPTINGRVELNEYLKLSPQLPDEKTLEFIGFVNQHSAIEKDTGNQVNITLVMQPLEGETLPIIFDIDAFRMVAMSPEDWPAIRSIVDSLRILKNLVFKRTLTEKCLNLFQQP